MARVSIPFPYPKCHDVKLVVTICPGLVNFSLHPSLPNWLQPNWLQLWSEYSLESLIWVIINKTLYICIWLMYRQWGDCYLLWLLLKMICRACRSLWTLVAYGCQPELYWLSDHLQVIILSIGYSWRSGRDLERVWVYTLDGFGLSESSDTTCFQFHALAEMIRPILPFWCSFASLDDVSKHGDVFIGSPRVLYGA